MDNGKTIHTQRYLSFRASKVDEELIEDLMIAWGCNRSEVIRRALQLTHTIYMRDVPEDERIERDQ